MGVSSLHNRYRATMPALGIMGVTTPAERLTRGGVEGSIYSRRSFVPVTQYQPSGCRSGNRPTARANR
jgi:hypothetical protein